MTITVRSLSVVAVLLLLAACFVTGISGPATVNLGDSATYDITFETDSSGSNGTAYVFVDVPNGWTLTNATYNATVNGSPASGNATTGVSQAATPCVAVGGPSAGYQRLGFSATFPTVTTSDSGTLHLTFTIGGSAGNYTLSSFGGGAFGGPNQQCNSNQTQTLGVTVNGAPAMLPPTVSKSFTPASIAAGGTSLLTITLTNPNAQPITGVAFTDTYPAGVVTAGTPNLSNTCGGTPSSSANSLSLCSRNGSGERLVHGHDRCDRCSGRRLRERHSDRGGHDGECGLECECRVGDAQRRISRSGRRHSDA